MQQNNILILVIVGLVIAALVIFLIWKNQKDKRALNPDAQDSTDNLRMNQEKESDKL